jgi:hypothetical protein
MASRSKVQRAQKIRRAGGAPDKSDQLWRLVARARGRCLAANTGTAGIAAHDTTSAGADDESAETMIPPAAPGEGELDHRSCAQKRQRAAGARFFSDA